MHGLRQSSLLYGNECYRLQKHGDLTILGKIQMVKTFIVPIFMYRASLICAQKKNRSFGKGKIKSNAYLLSAIQIKVN